MNIVGAGRNVGRVVVAAAVATALCGAPVVTAAPVADAPATGAVVAAAAGVLAPADVVRETGSWFAHGRTLDLRDDGTGTFASWIGAFDGTLLQLRLIPAPGEATVAEVTGIETVGAGALAPDETPGLGGLVTVTFGDPVRTTHVEWTSGPRRLSADLCPVEGLDAEQMNVLRCGA